MKIRQIVPTTAALALAVGVAVSIPRAARADSDRTDCMGNNCVHVHCYDDSGTCTRTANFRVRGQYSQDRNSASYTTEYPSDTKPLRYACDSDGFNCHWTRNYYFNDDGEPTYDSDIAP
jgi:hypothetical protein